MSQDRQSATTPGADEFEGKEWIEAQIRSRRIQFARTLTRFIAGGAAISVASLVALWLVFSQYPQLLAVSVPLLLTGASAWLYPTLERRGRPVAGIRLLLLALLATFVANPLLMPDVILPIMIGYVILVLLGNMLLGPKESLWLILAGAFFLGLDIPLGKTVASDWFPTLDLAVALIADTFLAVVAFFVVSLVVRQVVTEQEKYLRQSQRANWEVEQRAAAEQQRREHLQVVVERYAQYMIRVGQGDLAARLTLDGDRSGAGDPLTMLGHNLNEMVDNLQGMITQIRDATNNVKSAAAEILAATTQQVAGASEQSSAISQTTTTAEEVKTIAEQTVTRAQEVAEAAQRTVDISRAGQQAVQDTIGSMGQIKDRVEGIAENILALSEQTQQIGEIITTVNDIAAQSNILALNAAVEAARAGEQGKGFAVVAAEVRNLAEQSRQATAQVRSILSDIQKGTNSTVMATEEGVKVVDSGMQLVGQAQQVIQQLAGVINEAAAVAMRLVAGGRQQASGTEQIVLAVQNINQAIIQNLSSTRQAEKAAQDLDGLAYNLAETVAQYKL